ncbi:YhaN family protein [Bacillus alkalisoli]|uniref:YhaN family protein n=1 Tax=Bacillus alkalisoli TaxID=2011008 RepID=UPI0012FF0424|nr:YhaN family protein [Bacillus alkalisoli]
MRINNLHLKAFGHFTDFPLKFANNKNFHLLYGPNEAGKSTILRSVTNYLYGFPQTTQDAFLHKYSQLRIEGELENHTGEKLKFGRRKGRSKTALDENNNPIDEKKILTFLNGLSESQFTNMFALDHVRLRTGGESLIQSEGNVGQSLFSAASGINVLRDVLGELDSRASNLYQKNRKNSKLNVELKAEKEISKTIADNQMKIQDWKDIERNYNDGKNAINEMKENISNLRLQQLKLERLKQTLPKIAVRNELIEKCNEFANVPDLPEQAEDLRKETEHKINSEITKKKEAEEEINEINNQLERIVIPNGIMEQASLIEDLYRNIASYQQHVEQVPQLQAKYEQLEYTISTILKELGGEIDQLDEVEKYRITAEKKNTINELSELKRTLELDLKNVNNEINVITRELDRLNIELKKYTEIMDADRLESVIDKVKSEGKVESVLREKQNELEQIEKQLTSVLHSIPLFNGTSEELLSIKVPTLKETIKKFDKEYHLITHAIQRIKENIDGEKNMIQENERKIRELESLADIPTITDLENTRKHREKGWLVIRKKLTTGDYDDNEVSTFAASLPMEMAFEKSISESDAISDKMRMEAEKVGTKNKLLADMESSKRAIASFEIELKATTEKLDKWDVEWKSHWKLANINPLSPEEMLEWLDKYESFLDLNEQKNKVLSQIQIQTNSVDHLKTLLIDTLRTFEQVTLGSTLEDLLQQAEVLRKNLLDKNNKYTNFTEAKQRLEEKLRDLIIEQKELDKSLNEWQENWQEVLQAFTISNLTSPNVVKALLEKYELCVNSYDEWKATKKQWSMVKDRITAFEESVRSMEQHVVTNFVPNAYDLAVTELYQVLKQANKDQGTTITLQTQLVQAKEKVKKAEKEMEEATTSLYQLLKQACCESLEELQKVESDYKQKCGLTTKITALEEQIIELGNGRTLEELLIEAEEADKDTLDVELEQLKDQMDQLDSERSTMEQGYGVVKNDYLEKIKGTSDISVKATEEKQSKLASIVNYTDEYITYKLASLILQKGIEHYRENNQSPIMNRASEIFHQLTLGKYDKLTIEYDEKDEAKIMGVRNKDELVDVSGMSDGTTDQLFLSLRIAAIEKYAKENEPIPFIVDDILVHFDDERSKETLKVLLELSKKTQIIFFTHHYRIVELMKQITSDVTYDLIELNTVSV